MSDLIADLLNDRIAPVPTRGTVDGVLDYEMSDEDEKDFDDSSTFSKEETDFEQQEYVRKEFNSYFPQTQDVSDGLTDIDDGNEESLIGSELMQLVDVPKVFNLYKFDVYYKKELPIDSFKKKILDMINTNSVVIIHGPTGCGKTTQVPQYILDQCRENKLPCNIVVTQPRRIAAINISQRVCEERCWSIGTVCGYQVGLDRNVGEDVILTYMTTEVLLQKLISHKNLNRFTHIIIDEVHERDKSLDFLLLIVRKYLFTNSPAVKVILMSATMEAHEFAYYFRSIPRNNPENYLPAPVLHVNKKNEFDTNIYYIEQFAPTVPAKVSFEIDNPQITPSQYEMALKLIRIFDSLDDKEASGSEKKIGSVLVFLPGYHEIEEMNRVLIEQKNLSLIWDIIPLHSSLTSEHMVKVFQKPKPGTRKLILSTNIAESSVTVPDVKYVIDFCLTKVLIVNPTTKYTTLTLQWASKNNCIQRAGRVGRVSSGRVYRLVPCSFYEHHMQDNTIPELQRAPLENVILYMKLLDLNDTPKNVLSLAISPPNLRDVETCIWNLKEVGALLQTCRGNQTSADGDLTFIGRVMGSLPIDIRFSKLILLGHMFSVLEETVIISAGCMTRNIFVQNFHDRLKCYRKKLLWADGSCSDFMLLLNLYNVWINKKRENAFRTINEEYAWCKTNFINLKGLREWDLLIREINSRLKNFKIEKPVGPERVKLTTVEKPTLLKIVLCGAFYPNYFIRSSEFGQVDSKEALKILNGRDTYNTVYFTGMKTNQPGHIYVRQIKKLLGAGDNQDVQIGFDGQSSKVFVEFKDVKQPEQVTVDGRQYITTIPGNIAMEVYESVRKRQLNIPFRLNILPDYKAWEFANITEQKNISIVKLEEERHCYSEVEYNPLPTLDIEYITITVTHIIDAGQFYCQNWNEETRILLDHIFTALNRPGVFLEAMSLDEKLELNGKMYAARFNQDGKFYRCKILNISPGHPPFAHVQFIDYGNIQKVPVNLIYKLPERPECQVEPIAFCCVLSEVQPHPVRNPRGLWTEEVNNFFKRCTENVLLDAKVYSVVDKVVHLELYPQNSGPNSLSLNEKLIHDGYGQKCEESQRSKMDHETRQKVMSSDYPNNMNAVSSLLTTARSYTDFEAPELSEATETVELKGPFSPLEMKICGLVNATLGAQVKVEGDSVNAVLLDSNPEDPHARLIIAGNVVQSSTNQLIKISQTTIMPSIPGLPMIVTLLFCPQMEPKITPDATRVASILCGLGYKEHNDKPNYPMHDISLVLDTELTKEILTKINLLRYTMNQAIRAMSNIYYELAYPKDLFVAQTQLKDLIFDLLHVNQKSVDRVNVKYADIWNKSTHNLEILKINKECEEDDIWPMLWFVGLNTENKQQKQSINKNLEELNQIAKRLAPEREITCELCNSIPLRNISDVRIHLFREQHKMNFAFYQNQQ